MDGYKFKIKRGHIIVCLDPETDEEYDHITIDMAKNFYMLVTRWEPTDGKVISDSLENNWAAEMAAAYHGAVFIPYDASQYMSLQEYIDMGANRPNKFIEPGQAKIWELNSWGSLIEVVTKEHYPLSLQQKALLSSIPTWSLIMEVEEHGTLYQDGMWYEIINSEYGSALCTYYLNEEGEISKGRIGNTNSMSHMMAFRKDGGEWMDIQQICHPRYALKKNSEYYNLSVSTLEIVYKKYKLDAEKMVRTAWNLANSFIWMQMDKDIIDKSMAYGYQVGIDFLQMSMIDGIHVSGSSQLGIRFAEGSLPLRVYKNVLLGTPVYKDEDILYDGHLLKICYYRSVSSRSTTVMIKLDGKEYMIDNMRVKGELKKLGKEYREEYELYLQMK